MIVDKHEEFPVPFQDTWNVVDPSKIENWNDCKRKFFFEHILGWRPMGSNIHLVFGEGMHHALEHMLIEGVSKQRGYTIDVIQEAYQKFLSYFRQHIDEQDDEIYTPKTPERLMAGLLHYAADYEIYDVNDLEILYTEVAGSVPISADHNIYFRIDAIAYNKKKEKYQTLEHKSGSGINRFWTDKWDLHHQPFTYTHVLYSAFDPAKVAGVEINGIHFKKTKTELIRIPIWKTPSQMQTWLWEVRDIFLEMEFEFGRFSECSPSHPILQSFPKNPTTVLSTSVVSIMTIAVLGRTPYNMRTILQWGLK